MFTLENEKRQNVSRSKFRAVEKVVVVPKLHMYLQDLPGASPGAVPENAGTAPGLPQGLPLKALGAPQAAPGTAPGGVLARGAAVCVVTNTNRGVESL